MVHGVHAGGKQIEELFQLAEVTSQVIDVSYKCRNCAQCSFIEEHKKNENFFTIEYLDSVIEHETKML